MKHALSKDAISDTQSSLVEVGIIPRPKKEPTLAQKNAIVKWIVGEHEPLSAIESDRFRQMAALFGPIRIPCTETLKTWLSNCFALMLLTLVALVDSQAISYAMAFDGWTGINKMSFVGFVIQFIDMNWKMRTYCAGFPRILGSHTGANIASLIKDVISKFKPPCLCIVADNASNCINAVEKHTDLDRIGCSCHLLQLSIQPIFKKHFPLLAKKIKEAVRFLNSSTSAMEKFKELQSVFYKDLIPVGVIQAVKTRWDSYYFCLERLLRTELAFNSVLAAMGRVQLDPAEWSIIKLVVAISKPIHRATKALSGEKYGTGSYLFPIVRMVRKGILEVEILSVGGVSNPVEAMRKDIITKLDDYFNVIPSNLLLATLLNPATKSFSWASKTTQDRAVELLKEKYLKELEFVAPALELVETEAKRSSSILDEVQDFIGQFSTNGLSASLDTFHEVNAYLAMKPLGKQGNPLLWWKRHESFLPTVARLARKYLAIPCSSTSCEKMFSGSGEVLDEKRSRLNEDTLEQLVMLDENQDLW